MNVKLEAERPIIQFLVECTAVVLNSFEVGKGGKTAVERHMGERRPRPWLRSSASGEG